MTPHKTPGASKYSEFDATTADDLSVPLEPLSMALVPPMYGRGEHKDAGSKTILSVTRLPSQSEASLPLSFSFSFGSEFLPRQFCVKILLLLSDVLFVAITVDKRVRTSFFHKWVLFFESKVAAMGAEEKIAWQQF
jgi:hypothetical protein